jgi:16S rRNA G966 N2-methylase RsmD
MLPGLGARVFDVILLDPPYDIMSTTPVLEASARALASDGVVVLEHASRRQPERPASLEPFRHVRSGDSTLTFFALS